MLGLKGWFQFKSLSHVFCPFIISAHNTCEGNALTLLKIHSIKQNFHRLGFSHLSFSSLFCLEDISYWEPTSLLLLLFLLALLFQLILFNIYISIVFLHPIFYAIIYNLPCADVNKLFSPNCDVWNLSVKLQHLTKRQKGPAFDELFLRRKSFPYFF